MPVTPQFVWSETEDSLLLNITLQGFVLRKAAITVSDRHVGLNHSPHLLSLDLYAEVKPDEVVVKASTSGVELHLPKATQGIWGQLRFLGTAAVTAQRRQASLERLYATQRAAAEAERHRRTQAAAEASNRLLEEQNARAAERERRKAAVLDQERKSLYHWVQTSGAQGDSEEEEEEADILGATAAADHPDYHGRGWWPSDNSPAKEPAQDEHPGSWPHSSSTSSSGSRASSPRQETVSTETAVLGTPAAHGAARAPEPLLPPVRRGLQPVSVHFTQLQQPGCPARQGRPGEENLPVDCQGASSPNPPLASEVPSLDAQQLKAKGAELYMAGDYRAALHIFSEALEAQPDAGLAAACLGNRAACHLQLGDNAACVSDCTAALAALPPTHARITSNASTEGHDNEEDMQAAQPQQEDLAGATQRTKILVRRAAALTKLGQLPEALSDYREALQVRPGDSSIKRDCAELEAALCNDDDAEDLLRHAGMLFACQDPATAANVYRRVAASDAATQLQQQAACSNLAACLLALSRFEEAAAACNAAVSLLLHESGQTQGDAIAASENLSSNIVHVRDAALPGAAVVATSKQLGLATRESKALAKLLARRGSAQAHCRRYADACDDYTAAGELCILAGDPQQAEQMERDLQRLTALLDGEGGAACKAPGN